MVDVTLPPAFAAALGPGPARCLHATRRGDEHRRGETHMPTVPTYDRETIAAPKAALSMAG
jgi:hypothetical protein